MSVSPHESSAKPAAPPSPNRTRDHLANERTFLAWVRTSLGLIGLGFVLARMGLFLRQLAAASVAAPLRGLGTGREFMASGVVFLVLGTILCAWTGRIYERNRCAIEEARYEPARGSVLTLVVLVVLGGMVIVGMVVHRMLAEGEF